ncbi:cilia- and flagella-associated protein 206-like [Anneissia japonica]|uniref:cilia- and flagella-associated protein 206-like n=2 Tax=Anneissia japonica TaxID=1529436 RepID=UPI0014255911|nr:cilia- and flagella-associated protein 206-like [Anneissia japonica]XP_033102811.1 cilia- and flagella-associated protein 206-like [Anneissia japonica]XP_033102812.1 cilia- and flagella-associated protein 206-like [Anneissia japonica]
MSRAQAESVIKNIIREIAQECASKGQAVSETLVAFMVKAVVLDPSNEFNVDRTLTKDDVQKLIKLCVERLLDTRSPSLDTVKMQVYFDMNYTTRGDFLEEHRRVLEQRLLPVIREITDSRARTREELEGLYRKIVSAVLLRSGLGSPTDIAVVREATAALQSIFPQTELGTFMSLTKRDKERQLVELTNIVTGIRLFNKECGKGGEGIDDLPAILNEAIPATTHNVDAATQRTCQSAFKYTALIEHMMATDVQDGPSLQLLRESMINARQHEAFLRIILNDVISCAQQVEMFESQLASRMEQLQATVQSKTAVPTAQVYPQFINLSHLWSCFQDEMVLLSVLSNILASLEPFTKGHREVFTDEMLAPFLTEIDVLTDEDRVKMSEGSENRVNPSELNNVEWLFPETTKNFERLVLQYKGYCGWSLVQKNVLLIPGNPDIGVMRYQNRHYVFSSKQAAYEFANDPDTYIMMVAECAKKAPELIQLLELHAQFATITPYSQGKDQGKMIEKPITKCDAGIQTEVHPIESNIVKSYEWNEWELRRKAIKLANLRNKVTHSVQTNLSNLRRDNVSQVYLPKDTGSQTKQSSGTNVPRPQTFLAGLRGGMRKTTVMTKVDLTQDVDQT